MNVFIILLNSTQTIHSFHAIAVMESMESLNSNLIVRFIGSMAFKHEYFAKFWQSSEGYMIWPVARRSFEFKTRNNLAKQ